MPFESRVYEIKDEKTLPAQLHDELLLVRHEYLEKNPFPIYADVRSNTPGTVCLTLYCDMFKKEEKVSTERKLVNKVNDAVSELTKYEEEYCKGNQALASTIETLWKTVDALIQLVPNREHWPL